MFRKIYIIVIIGISLVFLTGLSGCGNNQTPDDQTQTEEQPEVTQEQDDDDPNQDGSEETPTDDGESGENLLTIEADTVDSAQKEKLAFSKKKATEWQSNSKLVAVQTEIPSSLKEDAVSTRYIYTSPAVNYYYWTIAISADNVSYIRALIPKEDYLSSDLDIIVDDFWKINYVEALQIADSNGGSDWREDNNLGQITLVLSRGQPNNHHYWNVEYVAVDQDGQRVESNNFKLKISSYDGQIVE